MPLGKYHATRQISRHEANNTPLSKYHVTLAQMTSRPAKTRAPTQKTLQALSIGETFPYQVNVQKKFDQRGGAFYSKTGD